VVGAMSYGSQCLKVWLNVCSVLGVVSALSGALALTNAAWAIGTNAIEGFSPSAQQAMTALQGQGQGLKNDHSKLTAGPTPRAIPTASLRGWTEALAAWEQHMTVAGKALCDSAQADTYYDSARVYYQIADYTHDTTWNACAKRGVTTYRDGYLAPNNFGAAGWNIFAQGLLMDWQRTNDAASKDALLKLAKNSAFAASYPLEWTAPADSSREVAYNVEAKLIAVSLGGSVWGLNEQVEQAFNHLTQWTRLLQGQPSGTKTTYVRPFMAALTAEALIQWAGADATKAARVVSALRPLFDAMWVSCWLPDQQTMAYTDKVAPDGTGGRDPAKDLNLLIAPVYAWLYQQTKQPADRDRADQLFIGGATNAFLGQGKMFNQNYRWSFDYLKWRQG